MRRITTMLACVLLLMALQVSAAVPEVRVWEVSDTPDFTQCTPAGYGMTYTVRRADVGKYIRFRAVRTDGTETTGPVYGPVSDTPVQPGVYVEDVRIDAAAGRVTAVVAEYEGETHVCDVRLALYAADGSLASVATSRASVVCGRTELVLDTQDTPHAVRYALYIWDGAQQPLTAAAQGEWPAAVTVEE